MVILFRSYHGSFLVRIRINHLLALIPGKEEERPVQRFLYKFALFLILCKVQSRHCQTSRIFPADHLISLEPFRNFQFSFVQPVSLNVYKRIEGDVDNLIKSIGKQGEVKQEEKEGKKFDNDRSRDKSCTESDVADIDERIHSQGHL